MARYLPESNIHVYVIDSVPANLAAISAAVATAGLDLVGVEDGEAMSAIEGGGLTVGEVLAPDFITRFVPKKPGDITMDNITVTSYLDDDGTNPNYDGIARDDVVTFIVSDGEAAAGVDYLAFVCSVANKVKTMPVRGTFRNWVGVFSPSQEQVDGTFAA